MGRRKKVDPVDEPEETILADEEGSEEKPRGPIKDHHWSDDGPRYNVMIELPDSVPGTRHYGTFLETDDLVIAKHECQAMFEDKNKTTLIMDRAEWNREIVRHEAEKVEPAGEVQEAIPEKRKRSAPLKVKRK